MEDIAEIVAIWRGETRRALKSGRVLVLLILFLLFVGLALTVVGFFNHQLNAKFEQQVAMAGADMSQAKEQLTAGKKQFLQTFVTEDEAMLDSLAAIPIVLLVVFKLTLRFLPLFIALMGFDQLAGEVGPKSIRYLVVRVKLTGDVKRLRHFMPAYRLRVGDWRVLFDVEADTIMVHHISHRSEAYD